ncbi:MAG: AsmA family protein [Candidatus Acidiferrum sp.]
MSKKLRVVLIIIAAVIVLLIILPYVIPVNQFRPTIEEKASAVLGRKVGVGNLSLSLISGSLSAENLSIGDDPKFSPAPFLTAKSLKVGVELLPLIFSKSLNVTGITIVEPQVTLLRNPAGQWNYSSLGGASTASDAKSAPAKTSGGAGSDVSVQKLDLKDGRITFGTTNSQKRSIYDHVDVTASNVSAASKFPVKISVDLPGGGKLKFDGTAGPVDPTDTALTPLDAKLDISGMNLAASGILDPSAGLGGSLDVDATLDSQNGTAQTKGTVKLSKALLRAGGSPASVSLNLDFDTNYDLRKNAGALNPSTVKIGGAVVHLTGTYTTAGENPVVNIRVEGQGMPAKDLAAFLPALGINMPNGASLEAGTLNINFNLTGPTDRLVTTGNVGLLNAKLAGFDLGSKMSGLGSLAGLKSGKDLDIEKFTTNLRVAPDGMKADNLDAVIPSLGSVVGAGTVDAKNNLDFKMAATLTNGIGAVTSPVSSVGGALGSSSCKGGTAVPFLIKGTTADPKFVPDVGGLAAGMLKSQAGCAGGLVTGAAKTGVQAPVNVAKGVGGLFGKKKN